MCIEDYRIGNKIYSKVTTVTANTNITLPGDARRVGIRIILLTDVIIAGNFASIQPIGRASLIDSYALANGAKPIDELWLTKHGVLLHDELFVQSTGNTCVVTEYFLNDQEDSPKKSAYARTANGL